MRVQLKLVLDCSPDDAWTALRSPSVLTEVSWPFLSFEPLSPRGMPRLWPEGPHPVRVTALLGIVPVGIPFFSYGGGDDGILAGRQRRQGDKKPENNRSGQGSDGFHGVTPKE